MRTSTVKDIFLFSFVLALTIIAVHFIRQRDEKILNNFASRWGTVNNYRTMQATEEEQRIAMQFSDTTLPQLTKLGLIKHYTRTEIETVITVSGRIWNERSTFFVESLLDQIFIYNKVNGFAVHTTIVDDKTSIVYAEITPPNRKTIF